jgi:hypothetical protein
MNLNKVPSPEKSQRYKNKVQRISYNDRDEVGKKITILAKTINKNSQANSRNNSSGQSDHRISSFMENFKTLAKKSINNDGAREQRRSVVSK